MKGVERKIRIHLSVLQNFEADFLGQTKVFVENMTFHKVLPNVSGTEESKPIINFSKLMTKFFPECFIYHFVARQVLYRMVYNTSGFYSGYRRKIFCENWDRPMLV